MKVFLPLFWRWPASPFFVLFNPCDEGHLTAKYYKDASEHSEHGSHLIHHGVTIEEEFKVDLEGRPLCSLEVADHYFNLHRIDDVGSHGPVGFGH
eukprot:CAMPEP_0170499502 /NCGR_PEP_ID=MMETSP0208-20121228/31622_1 /TAXON_ID=197538 /ORGANISM="Strombidium inclinatum, Strain S3" /LENGTH=94 /DNA_ID=CAMNT_0010777079 /DNA_START=730 /DNA_END=1014 /DNA_ORIENTATION=+